jgi:hypothetical protein
LPFFLKASGYPRYFGSWLLSLTHKQFPFQKYTID